jgi:peptide chain release factor
VLLMLLQISSAQGPAECQLAVVKAMRRLQYEANARDVRVTVIDETIGEIAGTLRSVLLTLEGAQAEWLAREWTGTVQWICASPYRPRHPRKNWFIGVERCAQTVTMHDTEVRFEAMRARGPGGQHVNKTSSAIRATHIATGLSVRAESERSQHANKRLAMQLLSWRLQERAARDAANDRHERRMQHYAVDRGNPSRIFKGEVFMPVD